jgi:hypothetical protein
VGVLEAGVAVGGERNVRAGGQELLTEGIEHTYVPRIPFAVLVWYGILVFFLALVERRG